MESKSAKASRSEIVVEPGAKAQAARGRKASAVPAAASAALTSTDKASVTGKASAQVSGRSSASGRPTAAPAKAPVRQRFASLGICCTLAWAFLINAAGGEAPTGQLSWQVSYFALAVAMVAFGFIARSEPAFVESPLAGYVAAAVGAVGAAALLFSSVTPALDALEYPATIVCSCVLGWLYLQWGVFYTRVNLRTAIGCLFIGNIAASVLKCAAHFSPFPLMCAITMALPVASVLLCRMALIDAPAGGYAAVRFESHNLRGLWKVAVAAAVLSYVTAFLVGTSFGNQSATAPDVFLLGRAFEVLISGVVLAVVIGARRAFNFAQLWRIVLAVLALDVLSQALLPQVTAIRCVESSAWDLLVLFTWLTVVDIARHAKADHNVVIGVGWAVYAASFAAGSVHSSWFSSGSFGIALTTLLMFALAMVGTFFLEVRDQDTKWIFAELSGERVSAPQDHRSIDERCDAIGAERGLTPRELEVMKMLCKGRTKSYIAETLYLTENTVRSHTKHIYTKLDVHSKQELMDLVGA